MIIYIGADHRGFSLKQALKDSLAKDNYEVVDVGNAEHVPTDDYPDFAAAVAEKVSAAEGAAAGAGEARGIVICGSGFGVDITANKFKGVRSALAMTPDHIRAGRNDDDVNVLSIAADFITAEAAIAIVHIFLTTPFAKTEERFTRRLGKISAIEEGK